MMNGEGYGKCTLCPVLASNTTTVFIDALITTECMWKRRSLGFEQSCENPVISSCGEPKRTDRPPRGANMYSM